jgi:GAF domain-containing protein
MGEASLAQAVERLSAADRLVEVFETVRTTARTISFADGATVVLRENSNCFYADEDAMSPLWKGQRFPLTQCISGWSMLHDDVAVIPDIASDDRIPFEAYRPTFVKSLVMVPVGSNPAIGAIGAYWAHRHTASSREVAALQELARAAAAALERVGLEDAPFTPTAMAAADD